MLNVRYIGRKPERRDSIAGTDAVWSGNGDIQPVSAEAWAKLSEYPTVWELASDAPPMAADPLPDTSTGATNTTEPGATDLATLDKAQLHALAKERGIKVHPNTGVDKLLAALDA